MTKDLVSVIMPAYNAEKWIGEAIDSILNQTYENIEFLIYDDGSTDNTAEILMEYEGKNFNKMTPFLHDKNHGITQALNRLIDLSSGKYIARMDADDIAMPDRIVHQVNCLQNPRNSYAAIGSCITLFGDDNTNEERKHWWGNEYIFNSNVRKILPYRNCLCHPSLMFEGDILRKYMYKTNKVFQDYDLFLRMASDGYTMAKLPYYLLKYRVHSNSESAKNESDWAEIKLKLRFLAKKFPHWNKFDTHVMRSIWQIIWR